MTADSSLMDPRCVVKMHHVKTLPLSEWNYLRPVQSRFHLSPMFKHVLDKGNKLFTYSSYKGSKVDSHVHINNIEEAQGFVCRDFEFLWFFVGDFVWFGWVYFLFVGVCVMEESVEWIHIGKVIFWTYFLVFYAEKSWCKLNFLFKYHYSHM